MANLDTFSRISPNQDFFFQKSSSVTFLPLQSPNFMQKKLEKSLEPFLRKLLPTNQLLPTTTILQDLADAGPKIVSEHF